MRLPRRVPWKSIAELDEVCSWIYSDENDIDTKILAVNRLSAWKTITTLPHALESTLSILTVVLQDNSAQGSTSFLSLRQSYATAVIRLVNGLVDPLQLGAYARSIASIAIQLDLPAWLVELRHAATHEDLPSIEVLRKAAREAIVWLLHHYFLPALNPTTPSAVSAPPLRPLAPLLKQYKVLLKTINRDASLRTKYRAETTKILRDIERWVAEAKVTATGTAVFDIDGEEDEGREKWALEKLCDELLAKGALVSISKKKRALGNGFIPSATTLQLWTPLITHIHSLHPTLPSILVSKIVSHLLSDDEPQSPPANQGVIMPVLETKQDASYDRCLAGWANWLVETWGTDEADEMGGFRREDVVISLVCGFGPSKTNGEAGTDRKAAQALLKVLCSGYPHLESVSSLVATTLPSPRLSWDDQALLQMDKRLDTLLSSRDPSSSTDSVEDVVLPSTDTQRVHMQTGLPPGWREVRLEDGWRPSPIGMFVACPS